MSAPDWITFDCYGTLIDWEHGIGQAFAEEAARQGREIDRSVLLRTYCELEAEIEAGPYRSYREVLGETSRRLAQRLGWQAAPRKADFLAVSLPSWPPFPDTNPALQRLQNAGVRLGILSNVDDDLLSGTLSHLAVPFDLTVTAQQVRSYKPGRSHFSAARQRMGDPARWLHAAQSYFHDVAPCRQLGIPVAWINRKGEAAGTAGPPDYEFDGLAALANRVLEERT
jgi:2-haloalkanoic acid dehalogenase type II